MLASVVQAGISRSCVRPMSSTLRVMRAARLPVDSALHTLCGRVWPRRYVLAVANQPQLSQPMSTDADRPRDLMDFPHIKMPSFIKMCKGMFLTWFVIRPALDESFTLEYFLEGAKEALLVISERLASGDLAALRDLVTPEALSEIEQNYTTMSVKERSHLKVERQDVCSIFPYEIGMIIEEEGGVQRRWVEITVCAHVQRGLAERPAERFSNIADLTVCNYRFIRDYTKGVRDSWTVNVVNHFKPSETLHR